MDRIMIIFDMVLILTRVDIPTFFIINYLFKNVSIFD